MPESNSSTEPRYVVGRLGRPHGLDGFLGLYVDNADIVYFEPGKLVLIEDRPHKVKAIRPADRGYQIQFHDVATRQAAESIRGLSIEVQERRQLNDDEFWPQDLVGLKVRGPEGDHLGRVVSLVPGAAQDRLEIEVDDARYEVPFITEFVPVVDIASGFIELRPIPGLIEPLA